MAVTGIAFTVYPVADLDRAIAFYRDTLGIPLAHRFEDIYAEFITADGAAFGLAKPPMNVGEPGSASALALEVDDIRITLAELSANGLATHEPYETSVCWITTIKDPDRNKVILHQRKPGGRH